jgi:hypothetical protein
MKNIRTIPELKGREFNATYFPKIRNFRQQPRQRIRQLLRSFIPLDLPEQKPKGY